MPNFTAYFQLELVAVHFARTRIVGHFNQNKKHSYDTQQYDKEVALANK